MVTSQSHCSPPIHHPTPPSSCSMTMTPLLSRHSSFPLTLPRLIAAVSHHPVFSPSSCSSNDEGNGKCLLRCRGNSFWISTVSDSDVPWLPCHDRPVLCLYRRIRLPSNVSASTIIGFRVLSAAAVQRRWQQHQQHRLKVLASRSICLRGE